VGAGAASGGSVGWDLLRLGWEVLRNMGTEPPREPQTYLHALETRSLHTEPTDKPVLWTSPL
jgi:hypothetical protein